MHDNFVKHRATFTVVRATASAFVFLCTLQALRWPILNKPGTPIAWWQVHVLAQIGTFLGFGPIALTYGLGKMGLSPAVIEWASLASAVAWALLLWWSIGCIGAVHNDSSRGGSSDHGSTACSPTAAIPAVKKRSRMSQPLEGSAIGPVEGITIASLFTRYSRRTIGRVEG